MPIYESDPHKAPDSDFEAGSAIHIAVGNRGRLLDARRTPVKVVSVNVEVGMLTVRIEAFEDAGARWDIPFEQIGKFQFEAGCVKASASDLARFEFAIERFDHRLEIPCDIADRQATVARLDEERQRADQWLKAKSSFFTAGGIVPSPEHRVGDPRLFKDLAAFMTLRGCQAIEEAFVSQYVSNPGAGEIVKGHRIVLARMGLVPYVGTIVRDPATLEGQWDEANRRRHIEARLGFVRAMFRRLSLTRVPLYRGLSTTGPVEPDRNRTFVSATFSRSVAQSHFDAGGSEASRVLLAQHVPVERVLMTYLETSAMNERFKEAEAILLFDTANTTF